MRVDARRRFDHGVEGVRLDHESELADEARRSQQAQRIFIEALHRIANRADDALMQIGLPAEGIDQLAGEHIHRHGIDGEIAPGEIGDQIGAELHFRVTAFVGIVLGAIGRDFDRDWIVARHRREDESDGAELRADVVGRRCARPRRERENLLGTGVGGEIEIEVRLEAEQGIAHDAANERKLEPGFGECHSQPVDHAGHVEAEAWPPPAVDLEQKRTSRRELRLDRQNRQPSPVTIGQSTALG